MQRMRSCPPFLAPRVRTESVAHIKWQLVPFDLEQILLHSKSNELAINGFTCTAEMPTAELSVSCHSEIMWFREIQLDIVTYWGFYSRWEFISVPKTQHTTIKYTQPFSKHTSGVYIQRCPTQDSFCRTSSGNVPTRTDILAVRKSPNTGASLDWVISLPTNRSP
jgi:hypothetical protein